ncbi:MAG: hypothetical protein PUH47_07050 [Clostridium sp.]|jgi:hypothetical protein|nr:hypothetical protein [Clostridium sp.]MDD7169241.1 hypothetical protein [Clostridium sp.]MDY5508268.1 hypothetical protein [Eubacteriales bacterium]
MMKKNSTKGYVILGILFALISIIAFAVPTSKTATFWIAYVFTAAAFAAQIGIWKTALGKEGTLKSKFLGFPLVHIGIVYAVIQVIAFAVFMFVPTLPVWSAIVVCSVIAGISAVCMISADAGRDEIERVEAKVQKKVFYIRELQADIELLADNETNADVKTALTQLAEKIRFSDPMSNEKLADLEDKISTKIEELKTTSSQLEIITELNSLLDDRNKKCKILK